ncbi:Protein CBR-DHS-4 [Aphelenchoides bicaudatus]|nr:Protein CBR-DHS-4 [Aphelenchoides bicaudatus]
MKFRKAAKKLWTEHNYDVDILLNTAGVAHIYDSFDEEIDRIDLVLDVNVKGMVYVVRTFMPKFFERRRGHIITIASLAGQIGCPHICEYSASKHAVVGYMDSLSIDALARGLHELEFTTLSPGFTATKMALSTKYTLKLIPIKQFLDTQLFHNGRCPQLKMRDFLAEFVELIFGAFGWLFEIFQIVKDAVWPSTYEKDVNGKNVLVVGSGDLGLELAKGLDERGARISFWDVDQASLDRISDEFPKKDNEKLITQRVDIRKWNEIQEAANKLWTEHNYDVDILLIAAGVGNQYNWLDESLERTDLILDVNLKDAWMPFSHVDGLTNF